MGLVSTHGPGNASAIGALPCSGGPAGAGAAGVHEDRNVVQWTGGGGRTGDRAAGPPSAVTPTALNPRGQRLMGNGPAAPCGRMPRSTCGIPLMLGTWPAVRICPSAGAAQRLHCRSGLCCGGQQGFCCLLHHRNATTTAPISVGDTSGTVYSQCFMPKDACKAASLWPWAPGLGTDPLMQGFATFLACMGPAPPLEHHELQLMAMEDSDWPLFRGSETPPSKQSCHPPPPPGPGMFYVSHHGTVCTHCVFKPKDQHFA